MLNRNSTRRLFTSMALSAVILGGAIPVDMTEGIVFHPQPLKQLNLEAKTLPGNLPLTRAGIGQETGRKEANPTRKPQKDYREIKVTATAYVSFCDTGCIGITKRGTNVKRNIIHPETGFKIIATDPAVIPLGSIVEIEGEKYIADDVGGAIKGHRIDILIAVNDTDKAFKFGKKEMVVKVFN